ncbi:beta-N-acetylhexosaminidase [Mucilaginibacter sp. JRF]|nr:beta-N-acetylhexosaminidase [Mucilaginibacter sp. JRF]
MIDTLSKYCRWFIAVVIAPLLMFSIASAQTQQAANSGFRIKGFHLDLRVQVMKMPALNAFALKLKSGGINTLIMEWEGTYPYKNHQAIPNRYAYTRAEVTGFIDYCTSLGIDVIPLQQSFGHVEYILQNYRYENLREDKKDYSQVNPIREQEAKALFTDLYKDMISTHRSPYFHIGGDETYLLGRGPESKKKVAEVGMGRLYGDYIKMLCDVVVSLGKRPVIWNDIALKYPDALKTLPKETILIDWNYGWPLNRFGDHEKMMSYGFEVWGAPSIRSSPDHLFLVDWAKHFQNITDFIPQSAKLGYQGMVMTSWSTSGLYSPTFETASDIYFLQAVRYVYPITGFNILIDGFFESLKAPEKFNTRQFILQYAKTKYGFNDADAQQFYNALTTRVNEVSQGKMVPANRTIDQEIDTATQVQAVFAKLKPRANQQEFAHYVLMADMRVQYLKYSKAEIMVNSPDFTEDKVPQVLAMLKDLRSNDIDKRFIALNKDVFYVPELQEQNRLRNQKIGLLYDRLSRKRD